MTAPTVKTGDEARQAKLAALERRETQAYEARFKHALQAPEGRAFVWGLLLESGVFGDAFDAQSAHRTAWLEGRRSFGVHLLAECQRVCPDLYTLMLRERSEAAAYDAKLRAALSTPTSLEDTDG